MTATERVLLLAAAGAVVSAVVTAMVSARLNENQTPTTDGARPSHNDGSSWSDPTNSDGFNYGPDNAVYQGAGRQETRSSFNGQIYSKRFHRGGQHNSIVNYEQSYAFQTSTKNPFANGNNAAYSMAVNGATQDPTNQVTSLVLGPGISPNNVCNPATC
jgi:hypothetical protein